MSDLPAQLPGADDEVGELFAKFIDQQLDEAGHQRLEELLRQDPAARDRCAQRLLFESDLKDAIQPGELEWLETRRVVLARRDGRPAMEVQRSQELRVGPRSRIEGKTVTKKRRTLAVTGSVAAVAIAIAAAIFVPRLLHSRGAPLLRNAGFETTDLSLNPTGNTSALIDWQDYFTSAEVDLCEIARVSQGRIFAKSGRNVARMRRGAYLTQRLRDKDGNPITAQPGARYVLSGWVYTEGSAPHILRTALRVVASGRPAMIQYEAANQQIELPTKPGWQPLRIEFSLGENLERMPSDTMVDQRPVLDLRGRELTLSIDSRGDKDSVFYLDDLALEVNEQDHKN
jgi:hypothetical protein